MRIRREERRTVGDSTIAVVVEMEDDNITVVNSGVSKLLLLVNETFEAALRESTASAKQEA